MTIKQIGCVVVLLVGLLLAILTLVISIPEQIAIAGAFALIAVLAGISLL